MRGVSRLIKSNIECSLKIDDKWKVLGKFAKNLTRFIIFSLFNEVRPPGDRKCKLNRYDEKLKNDSQL